MEDATLSKVEDRDRLAIPDHIAAALVSPDAHASGELHRAFDWLRANQPLGIAHPPTHDPFWVVTRQKDLRAIAARGGLFHNGDRPIIPFDREQEAHIRMMYDGRAYPANALINMDPPDHAKYRAVSTEYFHARNVDKLAGDIRGIARHFVKKMANMGGECDFVRDVASLYPLRVVMSLIGIPPEDEPLMLKLTQELFGSSDPDQSKTGEAATGKAGADAYADAFQAFFDYSEHLLADRRANPREDLATVIAHAQIDGQPMPRLEALSYCWVAATAGHDTTAAVTGGAMQALAENPEQFARLKADPTLVNSLIEEATRWVSSSKITMRSAAQDVEMCGRQFRSGDWIALGWISGNRDEAVFEDPYTFRIDRKPNRLISYGFGPHICLGQHLARLEMRILYEELIQRLDHVELAGECRNVASLAVSGPKTVPIRFTMK